MKHICLVLLLLMSSISFAEAKPEVVNFFINGVLNTEDEAKETRDAIVGRLNGLNLPKMKNKEIKLLHNQTQGVVADVIEAAIQRTGINKFLLILSRNIDSQQELIEEVTSLASGLSEVDEKILVKASTLIALTKNETRKNKLLSLIKSPSVYRYELIKNGFEMAEITAMEKVADLHKKVLTLSNAYSELLSKVPDYRVSEENIDYKKIFDALKDELEKGNAVNIIAHSQGNLFAIKAAKELEKQGFGDRIKVLSIATPTKELYRDGPYVNLKEDIVSRYFFNRLPRNYTNYDGGEEAILFPSLLEGDGVGILDIVKSTGVSFWLEDYNKVKYGDRTGHEFVRTYLKGTDTFRVIPLLYAANHIKLLEKLQGSDNFVDEYIEKFVKDFIENSGFSETTPVVEFKESRKIVKADLNNDDLDEILVFFNIEYGNDHASFLAVFDNDSKPIDQKTIGGIFRRVIAFDEIKNGKILFNTTEYAATDPTCCPSIEGTTSFSLINNRLKENKAMTDKEVLSEACQQYSPNGERKYVGTFKVTAGGGLRVRAKKTTKSNKVGSLKKHQVINILGECGKEQKLGKYRGRWLPYVVTQYGDGEYTEYITGYIFSSFLKRIHVWDSGQYDMTLDPEGKFGAVNASSTEQDLIRAFGRENLKNRARYEEGMKTGISTVLFEGTDNELSVEWGEDNTPRRVSFSKANSLWKLKPGISIGMPKSRLEELNGDSFVLTGYGWDYAGKTISWNKGRLLKTTQLDLIPSLKIPFKEMSEVMGDGNFSSENKHIEKLKIHVSYISVRWELLDKNEKKNVETVQDDTKSEKPSGSPEEVADIVTQALTLNSKSLSNILNGNSAVKKLVSLGIFTKQPSYDQDYSEYFMPLKPIKLFGTQVVSFEYQDKREGVRGCCVNKGNSVIFLTDNDNSKIKSFAKLNKCSVSKGDDVYIPDELKQKIDAVNENKLVLVEMSCQENERMENSSEAEQESVRNEQDKAEEVSKKAESVSFEDTPQSGQSISVIEDLEDSSVTALLNSFHSKKCVSEGSYYFPVYRTQQDKDLVKYEALRNAGLLDREVVTVKYSDYQRSVKNTDSIVIYGNNNPLMKVASYKPTSHAKKLFVTADSSGMFSMNPLWGKSKRAEELCFGHYEVSNIVFVSAPANLGGMKVAEVKYQASVTPLNWMKKIFDFSDLSWKKIEFEKLFREINSKIKKDETKKATLIATTKGWIIDE